MLTSDAIDNLRTRILSGFSILFLETWEEDRWEAAIRGLASNLKRTLAVWSVTDGLEPADDRPEAKDTEPRVLLAQIANYAPESIFLVKDFHPYLDDPKTVRCLRDLLPNLQSQDKTLLFIGPSSKIPVEMLKDAIRIELPWPGIPEIKQELESVLQERDSNGRVLKVNAEQKERMIKAVLGLTTQEAHKALSRALLDCQRIDDDVFVQLVNEKKGMVQGSDMLEFQELGDGVNDIGGLQGLKDWLDRRALAFTEHARQQGIPAPKGVLLLGVQGCGKSLSSRAIARLLSFPLVRLDVSTLLSADSGASEKNLRDVLNLMEMIAPAVLWMDEIEKGFAGSVGETTDSVMVRLVGRFLTWMQENEAGVFVVATANSITGLPPEMLRRGRFDELFFIDLPNYHERLEIFEIHLGKRGFETDQYDVRVLAEKTEGFSGAEIEQIVLTAMVESFGKDGGMQQRDLDRARDDTVPLSVTVEEKIFQLREWCRTRCRPATPDSRVLQMLEQEQREKGESAEAPLQTENEDQPASSMLDDLDDLYDDDGGDGDPADWKSLLQNGNLIEAVREFVRFHEEATIPQIQDAFAGSIETNGLQGLALRADPNVVLWVGLSQDLAGAISKLIAHEKLFIHVADVDAFSSQGHSIRLPVINQLTGNKAARPVWLPSQLSDIAPEVSDERFSRVARMKLSR